MKHDEAEPAFRKTRSLPLSVQQAREQQQWDPELPPELFGDYLAMTDTVSSDNALVIRKIVHSRLLTPSALKFLHTSGETAPSEATIQQSLSQHQPPIHCVPPLTKIARCSRTSTWYVLMKWLDGQTIADLPRPATPYKSAELIRAFSQLADDLQRIHERGIIHGDIAPQNVVYSENRLFLIDYGNAGATPSILLKRVTQKFLAPETVSTGRASVYSDQWALAAVLVYALTGSPPGTDGQLPESLSNHANTWLRAALIQALQPQPTHRYKSLADFARDLRSACDSARTICELRSVADCERAIASSFPETTVWDQPGCGPLGFLRIPAGRLHGPATVPNPARFWIQSALCPLRDWEKTPLGLSLPRPGSDMQARAVVGICQHLMRQFPPYKVRLPTVAQLIYAFQFLQLVHSTVFQQLTDERVSFFAIDPCTRFLPWTAAGNPPLPAVLQVSRNGYDFCCEALHFKHQWNFKNVRVLLLVED